MSSARFGNWADATDEDDEDSCAVLQSGVGGPMFETQPDERGIRLVVEYKEKDGKTYKVVRQIKQTNMSSWTNREMSRRKDVRKFGKPAVAGPDLEKQLCVRSEEEIFIEPSKQVVKRVAARDEAEEKFYEESLDVTMGMMQQKKSWTDAFGPKHVEHHDVGTEGAELDKPSELRGAAVAALSKHGETRVYVPPSLRGRDGEGKGKGKFNPQQYQEQSLRITNLSLDATEGDLQNLFGSVGRLQRVYLARDQETGANRGFAFITYYSREDALKAIAKLNGHGYDNLIMQVQFARPKV